VVRQLGLGLLDAGLGSLPEVGRAINDEGELLLALSLGCAAQRSKCQNRGGRQQQLFHGRSPSIAGYGGKAIRSANRSSICATLQRGMQIQMQSQRDRRNWRLFFRLSIASALISALFGYSQGPDTPLHSLMVGIAGSIFIATPIMLLEIKGQRRVLRRLRRLPLPAYLGVKITFYLVVILGGLSLLPALHIT